MLAPSWPLLSSLFIAGSALTAALGFVLAVQVASKVRARDRVMAFGWWAMGAFTIGTGLWASRLFGAVALTDDAAGPPLAAVAGAWAVSLLGAALMLAMARGFDAKPARFGGLGLFLALALLGASAVLRPHAVIARTALAPSIVMLAALAVAFLFLGRHEGRPGARGTLIAQWFAGVVFGLGMLGADLLGAMATPAAAANAGGAAPGTHLAFALAGAMAATLGLLGAAIDHRLRGRTNELASSLSEANTRLRDLAMRDPLTQLPNRLHFEECLGDILARCDDERNSLAVLFIDLDGFKPINDSFGHQIGDSVLAEIGRRLQSLVKGLDSVARVGGDEFLMLIDHPAEESAVALRARAVLDALVRPYRMPNGVEIELSCSIGIAVHSQHGPSTKLIANADAAMYAAKRAGGGTYAFFEPSMELDAREQLELQHDLRVALEQRQLELYYQPKIDGRSNQITGVEALVRWHHPRRGLVSPAVFIPVAERFGMIGAVGNWVIEEACGQLRAWIDGGLRMRVAVNLSMHQLRQEDLATRILLAVERHGIDASLLTFEITESVAMEDTQATQRCFDQLARIGAILAIDDFGTGYSSLAYLRKLPARQLKIDRSFIADLDQSADALAVVDAVIRLAHALGLRVVAEGVETERQRDMLLRLGCDELQGFLLAKPMPARLLTFWATDVDAPASLGFRPSIYADLGA